MHKYPKTTNQGVHIDTQKKKPKSFNPEKSNDYDVTFKVDWLSIHVRSDTLKVLMESVGYSWEISRPRWGYQHAYTHPETKTDVLIGQAHNDAEPLLVLSGSAVDALSLHLGLVNSFELVKWLAPWVTDATRIDLAIDIPDDGASSKIVRHHGMHDALQTSSRKITTMRTGGEIETCTTYIGARTSPRMVRCYTKVFAGPPQVVKSRIEQELKKAAADQAFHLLAGAKSSEIGGIVISLLRNIIQSWNNAYLDSLLLSEYQIESPKRVDSQMPTKEWLDRQVVPMLRRDRRESGHKSSLIRWLWLRVLERV